MATKVICSRVSIACILAIVIILYLFLDTSELIFMDYWNYMNNSESQQIPIEIIEYDSKNVSILSILENTSIKLIVIGFCIPWYQKRYDMEPWVKLISDEIFSDKSKYYVYYQECRRNGTAPKYIKDTQQISLYQRYNNEYNHVDFSLNIWFEPDIYGCIAYFLLKNPNIAFKQEKALNESSIFVNNSIIPNIDNIQSNNTIATHNINQYRSLIITYHSEWHSAERNCKKCFDILIHNFYDWHHHVVTVYGGGFRYDKRRIMNNSKQLILPDYYKNKTKMKIKYLKNILNIKSKYIPNRLMIFMYNYCWVGNAEKITQPIRAIFYDMMREQYVNQTIDSLGLCRNDKEATKLMRTTGHCPSWNRQWQYKQETCRYLCQQFSFDVATNCTMHYKFSISMESIWSNNGYWSEKLFNGLYAHTIPIYFGYNKIETLFNENRFINCKIPEDVILEIQHMIQHIAKTNSSQISFNNEDVIQQVRKTEGIEEYLQKCIDRVIEIDQNDTLYHSMLMEPVYIDNDYDKSALNPAVLAERVEKALRLTQTHLLS